MSIKVIVLLAIFVIDIDFRIIKMIIIEKKRFKDNFELLFQIRTQKIHTRFSDRDAYDDCNSANVTDALIYE